MKKKQLAGFLALILGAQIIFSSEALGWLMVPKKLSEVVPEAKVILMGKAVSFNLQRTDKNVQATYAVLVQKVLLGSAPSDQIMAKYAYDYPYIYGKNGRVTGWDDEIVNFSGLEENVETGQSYLFFFGNEIKDASAVQEVMRIDSIDKQEEISQLVELYRTFTLDLSSDKDAYAIGDDVEFLLTFKNTSQEARFVYIDGLYNALKFGVVDQQGHARITRYTAVYDVVWQKENYKSVEAGKEYVWRIKAKLRREPELKKYNLAPDNKNDNLFLDFGDSLVWLMRPGRYSFSFVYEGWDGGKDEFGNKIANPKSGLKNVFAGKLTSNVLSIEIR